MRRDKVIVVMPAYNAASTLEATLREIPKECVDEIILVDDGSKDKTVEIAKSSCVTVFAHPSNQGYGANQKTCYRIALEKKADYIVMIHPDYQYDSKLIPVALEILRQGACDIVLGNRIRTRQECLSSGMPLYKYLGNRMLTILENLVLGQNLAEFHSGFRAYRRKVLETIPFEKNSNGFVFDAQFLFQAVHFGFAVGDIPMPVRYFKEASSINLPQSIIYGLLSCWFLLIYLLHRLHLMKSHLFNSPQRP